MLKFVLSAGLSAAPARSLAVAAFATAPLLAAPLLTGCNSQSGSPDATSATATDVEPVMFTGEAVEMEVPTMHCPMACLPTVEATLAAQPGVKDVMLVDPTDAEDGSIETRRLFLVLDGDFDAAAAGVALKAKGHTMGEVDAVDAAYIAKAQSGELAAEQAAEEAIDASFERAGIETTQLVSVPVAYEFEVPNMHCPYGCFPTVKKTLAAQPGVKDVLLADPDDAKDGSIEDRRVFVVLSDEGDFSAEAAAAELGSAGFSPDGTKTVSLATVQSSQGQDVTETKQPAVLEGLQHAIDVLHGSQG